MRVPEIFIVPETYLPQELADEPLTEGVLNIVERLPKTPKEVEALDDFIALYDFEPVYKRKADSNPINDTTRTIGEDIGTVHKAWMLDKALTDPVYSLSFQRMLSLVQVLDAHHRSQGESNVRAATVAVLPPIRTILHERARSPKA